MEELADNNTEDLCSAQNTDTSDNHYQQQQSGSVVAPYLTRHIPARLYPESYKESRAFCYRHHPDFKCKRQADETNMEDLQTELDSLPKQDQQAISHVWSIFSAAPTNERNLILKGLLSQCCSPQLSYVSSMLRDLIRIDFVSALPAEISFKILCYLDASSLCKAAQVSRKWRTLADDDIVWHRMCEQHIERKCMKCGWGLPLLEKRRLRESRRAIEDKMHAIATTGASGATLAHAAVCPPTAESSNSLSSRRDALSALTDLHTGPASTVSAAVAQDIADSRAAKRPRLDGMNDLNSQDVPVGRVTRPWKDVYSERLKVEQNWRRGRYKLKVFTGHKDGIMCLQFDDSVLMTGSYDTTVRIWDLESGNLLRVLTGHVRGVRALMFDDSKLITGSMDRTIRVWNYRTGECVSTLRGHSDGVLSLHFDSTLLASGSADRTIRVWNFQDKSFMTLRGHTDWVNSVHIHSPTHMLFSASDDTTVRMWDLDTRQCVRVFGSTMAESPNDQSHFGQVQCVLPINLREEEEEDEEEEAKEREVGASDGEFAHMHDPSGHRHLPGHPPALVGGEYREQAAEESRSAPSSPRQGPGVSACRQRRRKVLPNILTSSLDNTIKVWDANTGACTRTLFGHVEGVWGLAADRFRIVSAAHDRLVKVWDLQSRRCLHTFSGHSAPVACVGLSDSRIVSGSDDGEVRVYSFGIE
ncbi:quinon protein alcohol dehydrogenase-like superfamily [Lipomyces oligophaga]|uniref:quinon protein alcohol dehydrogenase-like superfamily n=1 Tax=Lipomyces oligophaga TaxID=45792 RepID=UPI0034CDCCD9